MSSPAQRWKYVTRTSHDDAPNVHILSMNKPPENRLTVEFANEIISALRDSEQQLLRRTDGGAVILASNSQKFWCTGVDLEETGRDPRASADGFFPLLATLLDYSFPTTALITGHTFGGACPLSLAVTIGS